MTVSNVNSIRKWSVKWKGKVLRNYIYLQLIIKARVHAAFFTIFFIKHAPPQQTFVLMKTS